MRDWTTAAVTFELCCLKSQFYDKRWFLIRHISLLNKPNLMVGLSWKICRLSNLGSLIKLACGDISGKSYCVVFLHILQHFYIQQIIVNHAKFYYIGVCTNCGSLEIKCLLAALRVNALLPLKITWTKPIVGVEWFRFLTVRLVSWF